MKNSFLSQEEIDSLIKKNSELSLQGSINENIKNILLEATKIIMEQGSETLSTILGVETRIYEHRIEELELLNLSLEASMVKLDFTIDNNESSFMNFLIETIEACKISNLIVGGSGEEILLVPSEIEKGILYKVLNQMLTKGYNELLELTNKKISNKTSNVELKEKAELFTRIEGNCKGVKIKSRIKLDGLIDSYIIQILSMDFVEDIISAISSHKLKIEERSLDGKINDEIAVTLDNERERLVVLDPHFSQLKGNKKTENPRNLDLILDVPMEFSVILGKTKKSIKEILSLSPGSIIDLEKFASEPVEIYVNDKLIAQGEVVVVNDNFGVRITNILSTAERVKKLG